MASPRPPVDVAGNLLSEIAGELRYVARQPILDLRGHVHGYELLFRSGPDAAFRGDGDLATTTMIDNAVVFGLERLTGSLPAFVNCTAEALTGQLVQVLPPAMTVLEVLEDLEPSPGLIAGCLHLKEAGFRLALDDFTWKPELDPLLALADYVKVDFILSGQAARKDLMRRLRGSPIRLLAEKVETQEDYRRACAEGFTLFQGYYFCRPVLLRNRKIPANRLFQLEILDLLYRDSIDLHRMSRLVKRDAALTYRLLRRVNSPACGMRQEVSSIETALVAIGEENFRRIATLAIASELNAGQPAEILRMAFVRGRFCELAAGRCALDSAEQYLAGLLSLFPAMLQVSMGDLVPALPLRAEIGLALLGKMNEERRLLQWLECHERGDWAACDTVAFSIRVTPERMMRCYAEALIWAEAALHSVI
jgi:EAL and modified HD-GYP domain-containing signal transduction protein